VRSEYCRNLKSSTTKRELVVLGLAVQAIRQTHLYFSNANSKPICLKSKQYLIPIILSAWKMVF